MEWPPGWLEVVGSKGRVPLPAIADYIPLAAFNATGEIDSTAISAQRVAEATLPVPANFIVGWDAVPPESPRRASNYHLTDA